MRIVVLLATVAMCAGCMDFRSYQKPVATGVSPYSRLFNLSRNSVWSGAIAALRQRSFISVKDDASTGTLIVRYQGAPEPYVDCGKISAVESNIGSAKTYQFPAAKANHDYEVVRGGGVFFIRRSMHLEAHITLMFEELAPETTRVSAMGTHVLTQHIETERPGANEAQVSKDTETFESDGHGSFPTTDLWPAIKCVSTGKLEQDLLSVLGN